MSVGGSTLNTQGDSTNPEEESPVLNQEEMEKKRANVDGQENRWRQPMIRNLSDGIEISDCKFSPATMCQTLSHSISVSDLKATVWTDMREELRMSPQDS